MSKFVKLQMSKPSDVKFINLECVVAVAKGLGGEAKLYMADGGQYETSCSYSEFLRLLTAEVEKSARE